MADQADKPKAAAIGAQTKRDGDDRGSGFWTGIFGAAAGTIFWNAIYDGVTKDEKEKVEAATASDTKE